MGNWKIPGIVSTLAAALIFGAVNIYREVGDLKILVATIQKASEKQEDRERKVLDQLARIDERLECEENVGD
jgi:hypothetical protein